MAFEYYLAFVNTKTLYSRKARFDEIINSGNVIIIDFWAAWCGPCRFISPVFEKLSEAISGPEFYKVDVDNEPEIAEEVGIRAMPTFVAFQNGQKVSEVGGADPSKLEQLVHQVSS
jgi:thioredoxin 1